MVRRSRLRALLRVGGVVLMVAGMMFLPMDKIGPAHKAPFFAYIRSAGGFNDVAVILIGVGTILIAASWLVRGEGPYD